MNLIEILKKQGGTTLLKRYLKSGAFFTAIGEFFLLGKSRTALEILRLSAQLKAKQKLEKKYKKTLKEFDNIYNDELAHESNNTIWVCWFQGMRNAPSIVQKCFDSLKRNLDSSKIILITEENISEYIKFPEFIMDKWKTGKITYTHMTDLLRVALLVKYGGTWIDATVFCTEKQCNIPTYFFDSELFFYQCLKPGRDGHANYVSSWYMSAKSNNKVLSAVQYLCEEYWKDNTEMIDYFLLHDFISIVLDFYKVEWQHIIPIDNATPHILLLRLFDEYDEKIWNATTAQTPFHKLTYKFSDEQKEIRGTYYDVLFGEK